MKRWILFALWGTPAFAAGTVQQTAYQLGNTGDRVIAFKWTGDGSNGSVPKTPWEQHGCCQAYVVATVETVPGSPSPSDGYHVSILDGVGIDILAGAAGRSATEAETFSTSSTPQGALTLLITGQSVPGAKGVVYVFLSKAATANTTALPKNPAASVQGNGRTALKSDYTSLIPPVGSIPVESFGAQVETLTTGTGTTLGALTFAQNALPFVGKNPSGARMAMGEITLGNTGFGGVYSLAATFVQSPRVTLAGATTGATSLSLATTGFMGSWMLSFLNANPSKSPPNNNFNSGIKNLYMDAVRNDPGTHPGCIDWSVSINSHIEDIYCETNGVGMTMGHLGRGIDNTRGDGLNFVLHNITNGRLASQAMVWPTANVTSTTGTYRNIKVVNGAGYAQCLNPALDFGNSNTGIHYDGVNIENVPCGIAIGQYDSDITVESVHAFQDCTSCTTANGVYAALIDPDAANVHLSMLMNHFQYGIVLGSIWRPSVHLTSPCASGYNSVNCKSIVDYNGNVQYVSAVTGDGTTGTTQPSWSTSGSTIDHNVTWRYLGPIRGQPPCDLFLGVVRNCALPSLSGAPARHLTATGPVGASSESDNNSYAFFYDSSLWWNQPPPPVLAKLVGANFNSTGDQVITLQYVPGFSRAVVTGVYVSNASVPMTTAVGGVYAGMSRTGCTVVAAAQVYRALATPSAALAATPGNCANVSFPLATNKTIYLSLTTPQGSPATADVTVVGYWLP